ncbi:MAG: DUF2321 domain-containing protein [Elusimicrobiota bacterium]
MTGPSGGPPGGLGDGSWVDLMQVCRNGHKITAFGKSKPKQLADACVVCGQPTLTACGKCGAWIPGYHHMPGKPENDKTRPPDFCSACGARFPWQGVRWVAKLPPRPEDVPLVPPQFRERLAKTASRLRGLMPRPAYLVMGLLLASTCAAASIGAHGYLERPAVKLDVSMPAYGKLMRGVHQVYMVVGMRNSGGSPALDHKVYHAFLRPRGDIEDFQWSLADSLEPGQAGSLLLRNKIATEDVASSLKALGRQELLIVSQFKCKWPILGAATFHHVLRLGMSYPLEETPIETLGSARFTTWFRSDEDAARKAIESMVDAESAPTRDPGTEG